MTAAPGTEARTAHARHRAADDRGTQVNFAQLSGRSIVYCYPWTGRPGLPNPPGWDDIPGAHGSTPQTEGFRDLYAGFRRSDAAVFGLSTQAPTISAKWSSASGCRSRS